MARTLQFPAILLTCLTIHAANNYFVSLSSGSDADTGLSTSHAWAHAPTDPHATGVPAVTTLVPGDSVGFKGGDTNSGFSATPLVNGTSLNPIRWRTVPGWGTGRGIVDGRSGGTTNNVGFDVNGDYNTISDLEIRGYNNFGIRLFDSTPNHVTISNNVVHEIFSGSVGVGITINNCTDFLIVSNVVYNSAKKGINYNNTVTNGIVWGNRIYDTHDDAFNGWSYGYTLFSGNIVGPLIEDGNHTDGIQILGFPPGSPLVVANNLFISTNTQAMFIEPFNMTFDGSSGIVAGQNYQVVTNSLFPGNGSTKFVYNSTTNVPGAIFTGVGGQTSGTWQGTAAVIKELFPAGSAYVFNNIVHGLASGRAISGLDTYTTVGAFWHFNNTYAHAVTAGAGTSGRDIWCVVTNFYDFNNLMDDGTRGLNMIIVGSPTTEATTNITIASGVNQFTANLCCSTPGNNNLHTLAQFQTAEPGYEAGSYTNAVQFVNASTNNFNLVSGGQIGTNLTGSIDLSFLPAAWRPDYTKDIAGTSRGSSWTVGAYQASTTGATNPAIVITGKVTLRGAINLRAGP